MESRESQPVPYRRGYKEVPITGDSIDLKADCQRGDIVWWQTASGNEYQFELQQRDEQDRYWNGRLTDKRRFEVGHPDSQVWGEPESRKSQGKDSIIKGKGVTISAKRATVKGVTYSEEHATTTEAVQMGILRKESGMILKFIKRKL